MQSIASKIWLVSGSVEQYKSYFMAVWQYGQYYSHHYRGQVNALFPYALWPRAIVRWAVHGTSGHDFDYLPNRHEITG